MVVIRASAASAASACQPALLDELRVRRPDGPEPALERLGRDVAQDDVVPRDGGDLGDAAAHETAPMTATCCATTSSRVRGRASDGRDPHSDPSQRVARTTDRVDHGAVQYTSASFLVGPLIAFARRRASSCCCCAGRSAAATSVVARSPRAGPRSTSTACSCRWPRPPTYIEGEIVRRTLEDAGIRADAGPDARRAAAHGVPRGRRRPRPRRSLDAAPGLHALRTSWLTETRETSAPRRDEVVDEALVAAVDVVRLVDRGHALGDEAGEDEPGPGPDVARLDRRAGERLLAAHHRVVAVGAHVGAEADHLVDEAEPRLEQVLGDHRRAVARSSSAR